MKVSKGTKGTVLEKKNGWTKIKWDFNKKIGWTRDDIIVSGPEEVLQSAGTDGKHVASMTSVALQAASRKAAEIAKTVNVAVARPVPASETVKGFFGGKPPSDATIVASPYARVRSQPTRQASEVGRIPKGIAVKIKSYKQIGKFAWFEITFSNGKKEGWTREDNLRF